MSLPKRFKLLNKKPKAFQAAEVYRERFESGQTPDTFDKEILRRCLVERGFTGLEGQQIPIVDPEVQDRMTAAYAVPHRMITERELPTDRYSSEQIREVIIKYLDKKPIFF